MAAGTPQSSGQAAPPPKPSDERLLAGFIAGDCTMFAELVRRYERPLYGLIVRFSGAESDAPDLFQETFLRVFQHAESFGGRSAFRTWLYAIALNVCRGHGRKRRHVAEELPDGDALPQVDRPGPDGVAADREIGARIAAAVGRLPAEQREVFVLRAYEELTYDEIARVTDRPVGTVKSQMRLAVRKLRGALRGLV
jgi:RNA polymerase sigma-70 factor (ECF subfamily)